MNPINNISTIFYSLEAPENVAAVVYPTANSDALSEVYNIQQQALELIQKLGSSPMHWEEDEGEILDRILALQKPEEAKSVVRDIFFVCSDGNQRTWYEGLSFDALKECSISYLPIRQRVILNKGEYEKKQLLQWLSSGGGDPRTRANVSPHDIQEVDNPNMEIIENHVNTYTTQRVLHVMKHWVELQHEKYSLFLREKTALLSRVPLGDFLLSNPAPSFYHDFDIMLAAVTHDGYTLEYASDRLKSDRQIVLAAVTSDGYALQFANTSLKNDPEIVSMAVRNNAYALEFASRRLKDDPQIVLAALSNMGYGLEFASRRLRDNPDIVLVAVRDAGCSLEYASHALKNDPSIVLAALEENALALKYAGFRFRDNPDIVLKAINHNYMALHYASKRLRNNLDLVLAGIKKNGRALKYASDRLRDNPTVVLEALKSYPRAWAWASPRLRQATNGLQSYAAGGQPSGE